MAEQMLTYEQYKEAGFSDADIQKFLRPKLEEAGFSKTEVNQYFYQQSGDAKLSYLGVETNKKIKDMAEYIADAQYKASLEGKNLNVIDAIKLGWEQSVTGMLARGEMPTELTEEQTKTLNFFERTIMGMSSVVSDIPVYWVGGKLGAAGGTAGGAAIGSVVPGIGTATGSVIGAAVGGAAGAFGFHSAARQMLVDMYTRGEVASWDELMIRVGNATKEFAKGSAVGVATAGAAKVGQLAKAALASSTMARAQTAAGNIVNITAKTMPYGAEVLGLTSASSLVEGHVPTAQDFVDNAILIAALKGMNQVSDFSRNKIKNKAIDYLYGKFVTEGKSPSAITKEAQSNPKVLEEIVKDDGELVSAKMFARKVKPLTDAPSNIGASNTETTEVFAKSYPGYTPIPRPKGRTVLPSKGPVDINNALKKSGIFNKLAKAAEIPVRLGKVGVRGAEGVYKPKAEAIRIKNANDITTLAHEIGHHYEKLTFGRTASAGIAKYYDELSRIATRPAGKPNANRIAAEGFAEFIAKYIVNPAQAKEVAPKFYEVFEKEIAPRAPELHKAMLAAREDVAKYYAQPLAYEVLGAISNRPREELSNKEKWEEVKYNFVKNWLDDKNPIKYAVEKVEQAAGVKLSFDKNAYFLSRMFPGWSGKAEAFLEHKPFSFKDLKDIEGSKSLREIVKSVENWDEFMAYLVSARALELNARGIKTGIDIFAAKATERQLKKKYGALANDLYKYQDALLKYQLDGGLISKEVYDAIKAENQKYIPFYREFEKAQGSAIGSRSMKSKQTVKRIKGSTRDIINPLESIIKNTFEMINAVERNRVGLAYADMSKLDKSAMFVEKIPLPKTVVHSPKGTDAGERAEIFFSNTSKLGKDEILVYRDGKPEAYRVDPDVAAIINGTQSMTQRFEALNFLKFFTKTLRAGATGMNATFAVKNLIRDNFFAYMSSKAGYRPFVDSLQNAKIAITKDEAYWELKKAGGSQSSFVSVDRNALQKKISDFTDTGYFNAIWNRLKEVRNSDGSINYKQTMSKIGEALDRALDPLVLISETSELSTRIGEFRRSMKGKPWTKENLEKAGYNSREVTLDFAKGGAYSKAYNQFKAFFNANILGAEKSIDILTHKKSAIKAVWTMGMLGIFTALANYDWANGQEDQDIAEVLQAQKDTNWVLKVWGTDTIVRIPKPQQIGFISTIFEQLTTDTLNALNGAEREDIIQHLYQAFMRELSIPTTWGDIGQAALPTAFTPVLENWANRSMYFGTSIVPASAENALPEYQYTDRTTELSKAISSALGVFIGKTNTFSPAKMENVVRGWTGGVGNYIMEMVDLAARKAGIVPDPVRPADTLTDIPFVRAFIARHPSSTSSSVQKWYEESAKRMQYLKSYSIAGKNFDEESMEDLAKYQVYKALNPIQNAMNQVTRQIRTIYKLPDMSADDKRQTIDSLYLVKIQLAKQGLQTIRNLDKVIMSSKGPKK